MNEELERMNLLQGLSEPDVIPDEEYAFNTVRDGVALISSEEVYSALKHLPDPSLISSILLLSEPMGLNEGSFEAISHHRTTGGLSRSDWHSIYLHCVPITADVPLLLELEWSCMLFRSTQRYARLFEFSRSLERDAYSIANEEEYQSEDLFAQLMVSKLMRAGQDELERFATDAPVTLTILKGALWETFEKTGIDPVHSPTLAELLEKLESRTVFLAHKASLVQLARYAVALDPDTRCSAVSLLFFLGDASYFQQIPFALNFDLSDNLLFQRDYQKLSAINQETPVERVDFSSTTTDTSAIGALTGLSGLEELNLARTRVTNSSMTMLERLSSLKKLDLESTKIDDNAFGSLSKMNHLQYLNIRATRMTNGCIARLVSVLPNCEIVFE
ncbi:MAG: leucine-rich repeat domain-containing protein [Cyanobacteria bacterium]|nr:leucine-rich repeat domain-containing protein [Cyanobacteriota bacterium]